MRPLLLVLVLSLLGCGQRGPLYLPDQESGEAVRGPATSAEATGAETGPADPGPTDGGGEEEDREGEQTDVAGPPDR